MKTARKLRNAAPERSKAPTTHFILGTDTGVGKTAIACAVACLFAGRGGRIGVMKPVASGCRGRGRPVCADAEALCAAAGVEDAREDVVPIALRAPLSPHEAAWREGKPLRPAELRRRIFAAFRRLACGRDALVIEGVGGALVPLADRYGFADLLRDWPCPGERRIWLVAADRLGTINHTLLTLEALARRKLSCAGILLNRAAPPDFAAQSNARALRRATDIPVIGPLPHRPGEKWEKTARRLLQAGFPC